ncbi:MAG: hypothetical protein ACI4TB_06620, partial [Lachnospiraceae bacterium]
SGSGPTVFGIFEDEEKARAAKEKLEKWQDLQNLQPVKQIFVTTFQKSL